MMQFLWRYVDELVGKGLEMSILAKFFFYSALTLVPASLPLAILLASLITFGNFGERYELLAMKAAGISLLKIMRPLILFVSLLCCVSFYFQNIVAPKAQVDLWTLLLSMRQKSPELDIPEGVFYDEIEGYNLYVKHKDQKTGMLYNMMIYDFTEGFDNTTILVADSGRLEMTADKQHLYLHLFNGEQFQNLRSQNTLGQNIPYRRETFREKHTLIEFDAGFNMIDGSFINDQSISKDMWKLGQSIDSMTVRADSIGRSYYREIKATVYADPVLRQTDSAKLGKLPAVVNVDSLFKASTLLKKQQTVTMALNRSEGVGNDWEFKSYSLTESDKSLRKHKAEWHNKITLSLACLIFFFIGAPLGAIIRKGGLGMPVIVSVLIFIIYYIINNTGYKMARDGNWESWIGMWISTLTLAPLGAFLTYKSNKDSVVLNADAYINGFKHLVGIRDVRNMMKKEVIIEDPDYWQLQEDIRRLSVTCKHYMQTHKLTSAPDYIRIWTKKGKDNDIEEISEWLEFIVDCLSNTKDTRILNQLNRYPILAVNAHKSPFEWPWLNLLVALFVPLGLIFYFRIWIFRIRLNKDLKQIVQASLELNQIIETNIK